MSYTRPGRLYRKLAAAGIPTPLMTAQLSGVPRSWSDDIVQNYTVHRGQAGVGAGATGSTAEVTVREYVSALIGEQLSLSLTPAAAAAIHARTSASTDIAPRYRGRAAGFAITAEGPRREASTVSASSWTTILPDREQLYTRPSQQNTADLLALILQPPELPYMPAVTRLGARTAYPITAAPITDEKYSALHRDYAEKVETLIVDRRDGRLELRSQQARQDHALATMDATYPITQSQVLAPTSLVEDTWEYQRAVYVAAADGNGGTTGGLYSPGGDDPYRIEEYHDLRHVYYTSDRGWQMAGGARYRRQYTGVHQLPRIRLDLLHLIGSPHAADRLQAGQLLALEAGDPVYFSGDWWAGQRGIYFAQEITETLTPESWEIELSLAPLIQVTGEVPPIPAPRVWDSAVWPWDDENRTWNAA